MRKITDIYEEYKIPIVLQEHQIRVAGVVCWILDHWKGVSINKDRIVLAALFHDMANIIKFDFSQTVALFPNLYSRDDIPKLEQIKKEFIEKYGNDPHQASALIIKELKNPKDIKNLVGGLGFKRVPFLWEEMDYESMIIQYADMRVSPYGVESMENRLNDFFKRYKHRSDFEEKYPKSEKSKEILFQIEKLIIENTSSNLISLTEDQVSVYYEKLKNLTID